MEDYIQGILCGYLTIQNGTRDGAKRTRMFVVLSDSRMDSYLTDPRPAFEEKITNVYTFSEKTQVHKFVEINPRAPPNSICLTTDKTTEVYITDTPREAEIWFLHLKERLEALHQLTTGTLMLRKELKVSQQVQRALLQTKYKWRTKHVELGRSTVRYCGTQKGRQTQRAMNQFNLTAESYASEEPVEILKAMALTGFSVSAGSLSASELKKIQKDTRLQQGSDGGSGGGGGALVYPFVVCTGPAHLHLAALTEAEREHWIVTIKLRIIALKYRHNGRTIHKKPPTSSKTLASSTTATSTATTTATADSDTTTSTTTTTATAAGSNIRMHDFMEVQFIPGGPWKRRYVELENEMLKVKQSDRTLGSKFETRLLPSCFLSACLLKANAFAVQNLGREISLAPGTLQDSQKWMQAIKTVAYNVTIERCHKVFQEDVANLLKHSVVYNLHVAEEGAQAGLVVEKHKKRIFVLSHQTPAEMFAANAKATTTTAAAASPAADATVKIPEGSVLLGISQVGMVHDSFETIWHKLRQKKGFHHAMKLTLRAPMQKESLIDVKFKIKDKWALRRCVMRHGKLRLEQALPSLTATSDDPAASCSALLVEIALRDCHIELMNVEEAGRRNVIKITLTGEAASSMASPLWPSQHNTQKAIFVHVHSDADLLAWFALLVLECGVAQDDDRHVLTLQTLHKLKQGTPSPLGHLEDQKKQTAKCTIAGRLLSEIEQSAKLLEPKLLQRARVEQQQQLREDALLPPPPPESPVKCARGGGGGGGGLSAGFSPLSPSELTDADIQQLFHHLDAIGCGKISSSAVSMTIDALTRQLDGPERQRVMETVQSALSKLVPPSRQFVSITLDQTTDVLKKITDRPVAELVRKFSRHNVQCM